MTREIWDAYLPDGTLADLKLTRGEPIPDGYYHLVVEAMVRHEDGSLLFVKRAASRASFPNYWEFSCGGSALAGEMAEQATRREALEETGLTLDELTLYKTYFDDRYQCYFHIFQAITTNDKEAVQLQIEETADYRWVSPSELPLFIENHLLIPSQKAAITELFLA